MLAYSISPTDLWNLIATPAMPQIVDVLISQQGAAGLRYLDRNGRTMPW